jgi:hypothetical protein
VKPGAERHVALDVVSWEDTRGWFLDDLGVPYTQQYDPEMKCEGNLDILNAR